MSDNEPALPTRGRVAPAMSPDTAFFWEGTRSGVLSFQRCSDCGRPRHPPGPACPRCGSLRWNAEPSSGRGRIYSYVVAHHPLPPGFSAPAVVVLVELEDGIRLVGNLEGDGARVRIGAAVEAFLLPQEEGWTAPAFRLVPGRGDPT